MNNEQSSAASQGETGRSDAKKIADAEKIGSQFDEHSHQSNSSNAVPFGKRISVLDGVRGIAILMVLVFHTTSFSGLDTVLGSLLHAMTGHLWCGVDLFFVLSGFLISGILLDSKSSLHYFRNFYARRTLRIFPLYYTVLFGTIVILPWAWKISGLQSDVFSDYLGRIIQNQGYLWSYTQNYLQATKAHTLPGFGHFWSLAIEEQFYLLWPVVVFLIPRKHLGKLCIGILIAVLTLRIALHSSDAGGWAIRQWTFTRIDSLVAGALAAYIFRTPAVRESIKPLLVRWQLFLAACIGGIFYAGSMSTEDPLVYTIGYSILALLFGAFILNLTCGEPPTGAKYLDSNFLKAFGKYSYGIYVFHWPIANGVAAVYRHLAGNVSFGSSTTEAICRSFAQLVVTTAISFVLAVVSWNLWEKHWLRLKHIFDYQQPQKLR